MRSPITPLKISQGTLEGRFSHISPHVVNRERRTALGSRGSGGGVNAPSLNKGDDSGQLLRTEFESVTKALKDLATAKPVRRDASADAVAVCSPETKAGGKSGSPSRSAQKAAGLDAAGHTGKPIARRGSIIDNLVSGGPSSLTSSVSEPPSSPFGALAAAEEAASAFSFTGKSVNLLQGKTKGASMPAPLAVPIGSDGESTSSAVAAFGTSDLTSSLFGTRDTSGAGAGKSPSPLRFGTKEKETTEADIFQQIRDIYTKYAPDKLAKLPETLHKYEGREAELLNKLKKKYEDQPVAAADGGPASPKGTHASPSVGTGADTSKAATGPVDYAQRVRDIYLKYNQQKLDEVPKLLEKYKGKEDELLERLTKKYVDPAVTAAATGAATGPSGSLFGKAATDLPPGAIDITKSGWGGKDAATKSNTCETHCPSKTLKEVYSLALRRQSRPVAC